MDFCLRGLKVAMIRSILFSIFLIGHIYGDWNQQYDEQTEILLMQLIEPNTGAYRNCYEGFQQIRKKYLADAAFEERVLNRYWDSKEISYKPDDKIVFKRREKNNLKEVYVWEISSLLLRGSSFIPAFPIAVGGKLCLFQKHEIFSIAKGEDFFPAKEVLDSVSTKSYWEGHLQAYLFGIGDLVGRNIGVTQEGDIRFFDAEDSFSYYEPPKYPKQVGAAGFCTGFYTHSLGWPQFEQRLTEQDVLALKKIVDSWEHLEENIQIYCALRSIPLDIEVFCCRLQRIRSFPLKTGVSFKDFYAHLFPRVGKGMDELRKIMSGILGRKLSYGEAIVFGRIGVRLLGASEKDKKKVYQWLKEYIQ